MNSAPDSKGLNDLLDRVRSCRHCEEHLPRGPRPVVQAGSAARVLIIGQAPGTKVHESGTPWLDASGRLLREWLGMDEETFYDPAKIALMPMGFCYPGKGKSGDLPPRPECAPLWHSAMLDELPGIGLTLLIGQYAQKHYLGKAARGNLTANVRSFRDFLPEYFPLPHPSPRNRLWLAKNPWFAEEVLPELARQVKPLLARK